MGGLIQLQKESSRAKKIGTEGPGKRLVWISAAQEPTTTLLGLVLLSVTRLISCEMPAFPFIEDRGSEYIPRRICSETRSLGGAEIRLAVHEPTPHWKS